MTFNKQRWEPIAAAISIFEFAPSRASTIFFALFVFSMPIYCLVRLSDVPLWIGLCTLFTIASWFLCSLSICNESNGRAQTFAMLLGGFVIALTFEYLGSVTGFLFGDYDYSNTLGPRFLGEVPFVIPLAWFMMLYPSWVVGEHLVTYVIRRFSPRPLSSSTVLPFSLLRILIAALAMTAWDLSLDPRMVADGAWVWLQSGAYFGIPLSNYFGWFVTAAVIFTFWTFVDFSINRSYPRLNRSWTPTSNPTPSETATQNLAIWVYAVVWLGESIANAILWSGVGVAACVFVGMGMFALPALWILRRENKSRGI